MDTHTHTHTPNPNPAPPNNSYLPHFPSLIHFNFHNLIVASSNIVFIYPFYVSVQHYPFLMTLLISTCAFFSFFSHLYENHKHDMGLSMHSQKFSYLLNRLDVVSACSLGIYTLFTIVPHNTGDNTSLFGAMIWFMFLPLYLFRLSPTLTMLTIIAAFFGILSETRVGYRSRRAYMLIHCIWHVLVFFVLGQWLMLAPNRGM
jgi:hypothetical protein